MKGWGDKQARRVERYKEGQRGAGLNRKIQGRIEKYMGEMESGEGMK